MDEVAGAHGARLRRVAAAHHRVDARQQLAEVERLDQVVVGAELEPLDAVAGLVARAEDDDAAVLVAGDGAAHLPAVHARHHQVDDHQVRLELVDRAQPGVPVGGDLHLVALVASGPAR